MAGHSKWKQIKRKKAVTDARRGAQGKKILMGLVADRLGNCSGTARSRPS